MPICPLTKEECIKDECAIYYEDMINKTCSFVSIASDLSVIAHELSKQRKD